MDSGMDEHIVLLPMNHKKQKVRVCFCKLCDCTITNVHEHVNAKTHQRLASIQDVLPQLQCSSIDWKDKTRKQFHCSTCSRDLPVCKTDLENHAAKHVIAIEEPILRESSTYVGPIQSTIYEVTKVIQTKDFWKTHVPKVEGLQQIYCPASLQDPSGELIHLVNGVFSSEELSFLTKEAQWLEKTSKLTKRGKLKKGSRMVTFGVRYKYGRLAWYKHSNPECYIRSENLVKVMAKGIKKFFPSIFQHLENIRAIEGVESNDSRIGNSPFSSVAMTKDYNVKVHCDDDDFSYGFFLWLGQSGTLRNGNAVRFFLPELGVFFEPQIGDVMLIKAAEIYHCTRTVGKPGQYGIACFLKSSLIHWWNIVMSDVKKLQMGIELDESKLNRATHWVENNRMYQAHISA